MENEILIQYHQFGRNMRTVAIATVVAFILPISLFAGLVAIIFIFSALGVIKVLNFQLFDTRLELFRKKYISAFIQKVISIVFLVGGAIVLGINLSSEPYDHIFMIVGIPITVSFMVTGMILFIVGSVFESRAWENLRIYFMTNKSLFPEDLGRELIKGCDNLRTGALLWALGILIIPAIIGWIFQAVGFFHLAKLDEIIHHEPTEFPTIKTASQNQYDYPTVETQPELLVKEISNYCPNCGSKLSEETQFCPVCGSQIY